MQTHDNRLVRQDAKEGNEAPCHRANRRRRQIEARGGNTLFSHVASDGFVSKLSKYLNLWEDLAQGSAYHQTICCHCWFQVAISRQEANYRK